MPDVHSRLSPSSMARIIKCPGSAVDNPPDDGNEAADRGTRLHEYTNRILAGGVVQESEYKDSEEHKHVMDCVAYVLAHKEGHDMHLELRIESVIIQDHGGTMDVLLSKQNYLHTIDFKFGVMPVAGEDNKQLLSYLLLAYEKYPNAERFFGTIVQPAVFGTPRCVEFTKEQVVNHGYEVMMADIEDHTEAGSHCRWCPLKKNCETLAAANKAAAAEDFDDGWTAEQCMLVIEQADVIKTLAEDAKKRLRELLMQGLPVEGWRLARQMGNRAWMSEEKTTEVLKAKGLDDKILYSRKLISPAQLEKFSKAYKPLVSTLTHKPEKGIIAVEESSKLPEYTPGGEFPIIEQF